MSVESVESKSATNNWKVGDDDVLDMVKRLSAQGQQSYLLHISTPTLPKAARPFSSPDEENEVLHQAWRIALAHLPGTVVGKRQSWRDFIFLLQGMMEESIERALAITVALERDPAVDALVWRLVLSPVTIPWDLALRLSEPEEHPLVTAARRNIVVVAEGTLESPTVAIVLS